MAAPSPSSTEAPGIPTIIIKDVAAPRIALSNTKTRKVMCRGLTPKHKNIKANTLSVLRAMQDKPPFVPFGRKATAWNAVADIARRNPDLLHVTGALCEARYKEVRKSYESAQAASRRATGIAENPATEEDTIIQELIALEDDFLRQQEQTAQEQALAAANRERSQAIVIDEREVACEVDQTNTSDSSSSAEKIQLLD
ncbi:hypothetical protein BGW42_004518 [Actinomortierella wolfii]|nr:hypothetical protein BGW42_004518 [Actinomortierella wolfii]